MDKSLEVARQWGGAFQPIKSQYFRASANHRLEYSHLLSPHFAHPKKITDIYNQSLSYCIQVWETWFSKQHRGEIDYGADNCIQTDERTFLLSQIIIVVLLFVILILIGVLIRCIGCALIRKKRNEQSEQRNNRNSHALIS